MNRLNDEQMDRIIKEKFKQDNTISDKANSVFANFNPQIEDKTNKKEETNESVKVNTNSKVINVLFYKKLNKILSVAAVSLTMVLVGGTAFYFNRDKINMNGQNETITYTKTYAIKNEPLYYSKEQVVKEIENHYVKAYLIGNSDVCVQFLSDYWDELNNKSIITSSDAYKIDGIEGKIKDIFLGRAVNSVIPCIFVLMDDGTAMYVDLNIAYGYETDLYYYAEPLEGLDNIVGFEEKTRNFSYSRNEYTYVNAIRNDGKRKEIEFAQPLNWDDDSTSTFDIYNEKYIAVHNGGAIPDDGKGDFEVDNIHYWGVNRDSRYVYYMKGEFMSNDLYRVERSTGNETLIASGIGGMARNNSDGRISFYVNENTYKIYELDDNIVYRHRDESIINEITKIDDYEENDTDSNEDYNPLPENETDDNTLPKDQTNENEDNNKEEISEEDYMSYFGKFRLSTYHNEDYINGDSNRKHFCRVVFDDKGKPQIEVGYNSSEELIIYFVTDKIYNLKSSVAAGTTYIEFDYVSTEQFKGITGNMKIFYNENADSDDTIYLCYNMKKENDFKSYANIALEKSDIMSYYYENKDLGEPYIGGYIGSKYIVKLDGDENKYIVYYVSSDNELIRVNYQTRDVVKEIIATKVNDITSNVENTKVYVHPMHNVSAKDSMLIKDENVIYEDL